MLGKLMLYKSFLHEMRSPEQVGFQNGIRGGLFQDYIFQAVAITVYTRPQASITERTWAEGTPQNPIFVVDVLVEVEIRL